MQNVKGWEILETQGVEHIAARCCKLCSWNSVADIKTNEGAKVLTSTEQFVAVNLAESQLDSIPQSVALQLSAKTVSVYLEEQFALGGALWYKPNAWRMLPASKVSPC